jgi:hypothetical protein
MRFAQAATLAGASLELDIEYALTTTGGNITVQ